MSQPERRLRHILLGATAVAAFAIATPATALDSFFVGGRGQAMGGALTAATDDRNAQYYNPAAFGFFGIRGATGDQLAVDNNNLGRKDWGVGLDGGGGYRLHGKAAYYVDRLAGADLNTLTDGIKNQSELERVVQLTNDLAGIDDPGNAFSADATAGTALRFGNWGLGVRGMAQATGRVDQLDSSNLGISGSFDPSSEYSGSTSPGRDVLTQNQYDTIKNTSGWDTGDADAIDDLLKNSNVQVDSKNLDQAVKLLSDARSGTGNLNQNDTQVTFRGFGVMEVPLTYGYAINETWSVGGNLKFMKGRVYGNQVVIFDDDSDDVVAKTDERYEETTNVGVDVGIMGRWEMFQVGFMGRNLNSPSFDGFRDPETNYKYDDVTLDPQARAGFAFIPFNTLTLEVDYELTAQETVRNNYETQYLSAGLEWDAFRFLALRAGSYNNMAEDDIGTVYTAGLGLNLWAVRLDVAGAMSADETTVDGEDRPREARATAELSVDF
ncbi:conjugal transfer protein TraF [Thiohalorhabdus sp.]|uniref:conjugal transfer protein TraF n=1 Tax=Thiohalorhabdus sp. TaxID=3094134 RepID=UPI002FC3C3F3